MTDSGDAERGPVLRTHHLNVKCYVTVEGLINSADTTETLGLFMYFYSCGKKMEASRGFIFSYEEPVMLTEKDRCILKVNDVEL